MVTKTGTASVWNQIMAMRMMLMTGVALMTVRRGLRRIRGRGRVPAPIPTSRSSREGDQKTRYSPDHGAPTARQKEGNPSGGGTERRFLRNGTMIAAPRWPKRSSSRDEEQRGTAVKGYSNSRTLHREVFPPRNRDPPSEKREVAFDLPAGLPLQGKNGG
jgi:hypothetical protein